MPSILGVELARVGTWDLVTGRRTFTLEDFVDAVAASQDPEFGAAGVWPGHTDPRFDGEPALGRVENMRVVGDRLVGDLVDLPGWLTPRIAAAYPERSVEGYVDVPASSGRTYRLVVTGVALLGVTAPAMRGLRDLPAALAAGAHPIAAASTAMDLGNGPTSASTEQETATVTESRNESREGVAGMDHAAELRRVLGLAEDASDEDLQAAVAARPEPSNTNTNSGTGDQGTGTPPATPATTTPAATGTVTPAPTTPPTPPATDTGTPTMPTGSGINPTPPPGFALISEANLAELQQGAAAGIAASATLAKQAEDAFIVRHRRRIGPASNPHAKRVEDHMRREWQRNQGEAEAFAAALHEAPATEAHGHEGGADVDGVANQFGEIVRQVWPTVAAVRAEREKRGS